jgi:ABC-type dipeptide/oligopeptide/nickel transport system permease subunit
MGDERMLIATASGAGRLWVGVAILLALVALSLGAPLLAPHNPLDQDLLNTLLPPFWRAGADPAFPLGTDSLGRDVLSRLIYGARVALIVALVAASLAALLGTLFGLVAGFFGGALDSAISRLVEIWMSFPPVLLSIVLVAVIGAGLDAVILAIVIVDWTRFCRVVRAEVLVQKAQDYVASARIIGLSGAGTLMREIIPNVLPLLIVLLSLEMGIAVIVETILSFVGLSVASDTPTWGGLIAEGRLYINQAWWLMVLPMSCVVAVVLGFNALGDGLRALLDPIMRQ